MSIRHRPMQPKDVRACVEIVAAHPVIAAWYGDAIADLRPALLRLLGCEAAKTIVFEDVEGAHVRIWGVGISVFVSDEFLRELKTPPLSWIGPELAKRIVRGNSPVLSDRQVQEANSCGGLNAVVWEGCIRPEDIARTEATSTMMGVFFEEHRGYLLKETIAAQAAGVEHLQMLLNSGALLWGPEHGHYLGSVVGNPHEVVGKPHVLGQTRELAQKQHGLWAANLFVYERPRFCFSRGEQRLLVAALRGGTDEELADELATSLATVKKMWLSIYQRVASCAPELIPVHSQADVWMPERGKEKKHRLLGYLREHPEELRPVSRKLLQQSAAGSPSQASAGQPPRN
jgi:hypothetical protein